MEKKRWAAAGACVLALAAGAVLLRPAYDSYLERDHAETCTKARFVLLDRYNNAIVDMAQQGVREDEIDYETLLRETAVRLYDIPVEDNALGGLCRSGGTWNFAVDPETHRYEITCDHEGHGSYTLGEGTFFRDSVE